MWRALLHVKSERESGTAWFRVQKSEEMQNDKDKAIEKYEMYDKHEARWSVKVLNYARFTFY